MLKTIGALTLAALMVAPALAQDEAKSRKKNARAGNNGAATQLIKLLKPVGLTDDQVTKIKELGKGVSIEMKKIRDDAGITAELTKKRAEVQKSMKDSDKKGKELLDAINEKSGFTAAQAAGLKKATAVRNKFRASVVALLTDDQKTKLPPRLQRILKSGDAKTKKRAAGKKEKTDA